MTLNRLILGDNLEILKSMEADSVDLIHLDYYQNYSRTTP
jgi:DNA modification methylase